MTADDHIARTCGMADPFTFARALARASGYGDDVARLILHRALGRPPPAGGTA